MLKRIYIIAVIFIVVSCAPPPAGPRPPANNQPETILPNQPINTSTNVVNTPPTNNNENPTNTQPSTIIEEGNCISEHFWDVQADSANQAYPDPHLDVSCTNNEVVIQTNNIPNYEFVNITPNGLQAANRTFTLPRTPTPAQNPSSVPLAGEIAISVNGLLIFGPTEAGRMNYGDPYLDQILDFCNGHTAPQGLYHLHARPDCLLSSNNAENVGRVVGYAFDGYPILAPYICEDEACTTIKTLQSSWQDTNPNLEHAWERHSYVAGSGDLDQCNGMVLEDGSYAYFATDTFPYIIGCYYGEVTRQRR